MDRELKSTNLGVRLEEKGEDDGDQVTKEWSQMLLNSNLHASRRLAFYFYFLL